MQFFQDLLALRLGDGRLNKRGWLMADRIRERADASFPSLFCQSAELEGAYRWFSHEDISPDTILDPHVESTARRVLARRNAIVIHDTMDVESAKDVGFRMHHSLAITDPAHRIPLGMLSVIPIRRHPRKKKSEDAETEFGRWLQGIKNSRAALGLGASIIHVADCEADSYELIANTIGSAEKFVFRLRNDRTVEAEGIADAIRLSELTPKIAAITEREVFLSPRKRGNKSKADQKAHPIRQGRQAKLQIAAKAVVFKRPRNANNKLPDELILNIVSAREIDPPAEMEPVEWLLASNLPIDTAEQVLYVLDTYRARWTIEEFHKGLKTGCSLEDRQLESQHSMLNATALLIPIALDILALKTASKIEPDAPATDYLPEIRILVLVHFSPIKLPPNPTVRQAYLAIAKLGGHIKNNGEPGWIVLYRGFQRLLTYEEAWTAALRAGKM